MPEEKRLGKPPKRIGNPGGSLTEGFSEIINRRVGFHCRSIREEYNKEHPTDIVTQALLANKINVSLPSMGNFERGRYSAQIDTLEKIAEFWGIDVQVMLADIQIPTMEEVFDSPRIKKLLSEA